MIVRIMGGGGQYRVDDSLLERLNELDDEASAALERNDEAERPERDHDNHGEDRARVCGTPVGLRRRSSSGGRGAPLGRSVVWLGESDRTGRRDGCPLDCGDGPGSILRLHHAVSLPLDVQPEQIADLRVVVDDENRGHDDRSV